MTTNQPIAMLSSISKSYQMESVSVPVLKDVDLLIREAHFTVILGPSGSGKTTLLNLVGCLDRQDTGQITVCGQSVDNLTSDELSNFRSNNIGFVFQGFNLIPVLTTAENIEYPLIVAGMSAARRKRRVERLLNAVGLEERAKNLPGQLSGGQRQRVAIARALARKPRLVIADEPTANLDSQTGKSILHLMRKLQERYGISFLFSSHDSTLISVADDIIVLRDGAVASIKRRSDGDAGERLSYLDTIGDGGSHA